MACDLAKEVENINNQSKIIKEATAEILKAYKDMEV